MTKEERIAHLSEALRKAQEARAMAASSVWADSWKELDSTLVDSLLQCGPTEDEKRFRLQTAIEVGRTMRRLIEHKGNTEQLEKELAILEGVKMRPIA